MITIKIPELGSSATEEHVILRATPNLAREIKQRIQNDEIAEISVKFADNRHAKVYVADREYDAVLVDLPCIIESHKTMNDKQFYKISDISQMLIVTDADKIQEIESKDYLWDDGLCKPLQRNILEEIEKVVQKLINQDRRALHVEYVVKEEGLPGEEDDDAAESDDSALAAQIEYGLLRDESGSEQEIEESTEKLNEEEIKRSAIEEEIRSLESKITDKKVQMTYASNPIVKKRFETAIEAMKVQVERLQAELLASFATSME